MPKRYLETGCVAGTHGVRGEMRVEPWADSPEFLCQFDAFYLEEGKRQWEVESIRVHKSMVLMKVKGIEDMNTAQAARGTVLYVDREDIELEEDQWFVQDLIGLQVIDADTGEAYGQLTDVSETGANDIYEVTFPDGKKHWIPAIPDVIAETDVDGGRLTVRPMRGMFDED